MKQTAVEWLVEKIFSNIRELTIEETIELAKEMEKQQIIDAYEDGNYENGMGICEPKQYYNETFKKE